MQYTELRGESVTSLLEKRGMEAEELLRNADEVRKNYVGDTTCVHAIVEFSNYCRNNCLYCGLRRDNKKLLRYRMAPDEIVTTVEHAANRLGYKMVVLQSGEDVYYTAEMLEGIVRKIKERCRTLIFLSIGDRDYETYERLKKAGADGVLYRFETSNERLFERLRPGTSFRLRLAHLHWARELNYLIATGSMIGIPGQTYEDLAADVRLVGEIGARMASFGPFIPHPDTPLAGSRPGSAELTLKTIAITRILYNKMRIPVTTALETLGEDYRRKALESGANSLMVNVTPMRYRAHYQIYPGKFGTKEEAERATAEAFAFVKSIGRRICRGWGPWKAEPNFEPVCR